MQESYSGITLPGLPPRPLFDRWVAPSGFLPPNAGILFGDDSPGPAHSRGRGRIILHTGGAWRIPPGAYPPRQHALEVSRGTEPCVSSPSNVPQHSHSIATASPMNAQSVFRAPHSPPPARHSAQRRTPSRVQKAGTIITFQRSEVPKAETFIIFEAAWVSFKVFQHSHYSGEFHFKANSTTSKQTIENPA